MPKPKKLTITITETDEIITLPFVTDRGRPMAMRLWTGTDATGVRTTAWMPEWIPAELFDAAMKRPDHTLVQSVDARPEGAN